jgi:hypothetical protein
MGRIEGCKDISIIEIALWINLESHIVQWRCNKVTWPYVDVEKTFKKPSPEGVTVEHCLGKPASPTHLQMCPYTQNWVECHLVAVRLRMQFATIFLSNWNFGRSFSPSGILKSIGSLSCCWSTSQNIVHTTHIILLWTTQSSTYIHNLASCMDAHRDSTRRLYTLFRNRASIIH